MKLYKLLTSNWVTYFGTPQTPIVRDVTIIAQTPSCDAFLLLAKETQAGLELLSGVPDGFDFTYCQEWGLTVDDDVVDRVIIDLRKKAYPIWQDQLDNIYHNGIDGWKATIKTTKDKYPKV